MKQILVIAVVAYFVLHATSSSLFKPSYNSDYIYIEKQGAYYKLHKLFRSWHEAYQYCRLEGGALLYPSSEEEKTLLVEMVQRFLPNGTETWIGAHDLFKQDLFTDLNGTDITKYEQIEWLPNSPTYSNYYRPVKNCVLMNYEGKIDKQECQMRRPFVCKKFPNTTFNSACNTIDKDYMANEDLTKCYKVHKIPKTWTEAFTTCHVEKSYLAIVNDREEANFIVKEINAILKDVRGEYNTDYIAVGFHDKFQEGVYLTIHGQPLDTVFDEWAEGQPDNENNNENCGSISIHNGLLNDMVCDTSPLLFMCERDITKPDNAKTS